MIQLVFPKALWLVAIPLAMTAFFIFRKKRTSGIFLRLSTMPGALAARKRWTKWAMRGTYALGLVAAMLMAYVIARPVLFSQSTKRIAEGIDIVLVLDVSESMEATDFQPNRMVVAKEVISQFVRKRVDDRIGLITFGGEAITKVPLTRDYDFLLTQLEEVKMRELKQGTAIGMGLANGISRLRSSESKTKVLILITDGDSNVGAINPITAAHLGRQEGIRIYSIGIGKEDRVVIPIYAHDIYGRRLHLIGQVPSYINPELLKEISRITGGRAYMARDNGMLAAILREVDTLEKSPVRKLVVPKREEAFFYPALLATVLIALFVFLQETRLRRGYVGPSV